MSASAYTQFAKMAKETAHVQSILSLLGWDQEVMMPTEGGYGRSIQSTFMAHLIHGRLTGAPYRRRLARCIDLSTGALLGDYAPIESANLHEAYRQWSVDARTPATWVKRLAKIHSEAPPVWAKAREQHSFALFKPWLEKVVALNQERAQFLGFNEHPYDALLDHFEPGLTLSQLQPIYRELQDALVPLRNDALAKPPLSAPEGLSCSPEQQLAICRKLLISLGLTTARARIDTSSHPFCSGIAPHDIRLTTRVHSPEPWSAISATMHEAGHGLYDGGLPVEGFGLAQGTYCSLGVHESQSRLWECRIGHSYPFLEWMAQQLHEQGVGKIDLPHLVRWLNRVHRTPIRIEADEVSYSLHIILRTVIEADLVSGRLAVADVPEAWNALSRELLGIEPEHDGVGCLQDIHWALGEMGYFPSYALGNIYGAQLFAAYTRSHPGFESDIRKGHFAPLQAWLQKHVWQFGRTVTPTELIRQATGENPSPRAFIEAVRARMATLA